MTGRPGPKLIMMHQVNRFAGVIADKAGVLSYLHGAN